VGVERIHAPACGRSASMATGWWSAPGHRRALDAPGAPRPLPRLDGAAARTTTWHDAIHDPAPATPAARTRRSRATTAAMARTPWHGGRASADRRSCRAGSALDRLPQHGPELRHAGRYLECFDFCSPLAGRRDPSAATGPGCGRDGELLDLPALEAATGRCCSRRSRRTRGGSSPRLGRQRRPGCASVGDPPAIYAAASASAPRTAATGSPGSAAAAGGLDRRDEADVVAPASTCSRDGRSDDAYERGTAPAWRPARGRRGRPPWSACRRCAASRAHEELLDARRSLCAPTWKLAAATTTSPQQQLGEGLIDVAQALRRRAPARAAVR